MTDRHSDPFRALAQSSIDLLHRFGLERVVNTSIDGHIAVFQEEVAELIEAAQQEVDKQHIGEEAADVIVTVINLCYALGVDPEMLVKQMTAVAAKNDAKTHDTHVYLNGKIRRRQAQK